MEEEKKEEIKQEIEAPVTPVVPTPQEEKPKKNVLVFIIISLVVLIGVGVLLLVLLTGNKDNDKPKEKEQQEQKEEENEEEKEPEKKYKLDVYRYNDDDTICLSGKSDYCSKIFFSIDTETPNAKLIDFSDYSKFLLYQDNGLKIYDVANRTSKKIELEDTFKDYKLHTDEKNTKVIAISYTTSDNYHEYYNLLLNKKLYQNRFKSESSDWFYQVNDNYIVFTIDEKTYLLNASKEETVLTDKSEYDASSYRSYGENGEYVYLLERCTGTCGLEKIYSNDFKLIFENKADDDGYYDVKGKHVYVYDSSSKVIKKFDFKGNLVSTSKEYNNIRQIDNGYVIYVNNNKYIIENIDEPTESKEMAPYDDNKGYYDIDSGYYTRKDLDELGEKDKKEGFYIVIVYIEQDKNTGYYGMEYCYTTTKEILTFPIEHEVGGRAKPILYLYPTVDTKVEVKLSHPEHLSTTYPKYNNAIKFLEEELTYIGLNDKERNEFIMYWLPILEKNGKSLVYFELTEEREANNKLLITPTPDSLLRVNIHIKKVNSKVDIKEQKLTSFNRHGFTAVEWGGMTY